jgi:hypothetical protein
MINYIRNIKFNKKECIGTKIKEWFTNHRLTSKVNVKDINKRLRERIEIHYPFG